MPNGYTRRALLDLSRVEKPAKKSSASRRSAEEKADQSAEQSDTTTPSKES